MEGGAAQIAHQTAIELRTRGHRVLFFCAVAPVSERLLESGVEVVCLHQADILHEKNRVKAVLRGMGNAKAKSEFERLLSSLDRKQTVVHIHTWTKALSSVVFSVARKLGFQTAVTVHDYFLVCPNGGLYDYKKGKLCEKKPMSVSCVCANCDARSYPQKLFRVLRQNRQSRNLKKFHTLRYFFISEFAREQFLKRKGVPQEMQRLLPNPVETFEPRERVACEDNQTYLYVGRVSEEKGIRVFCEAVAHTQVRGVVVGDGPLLEELKEKYLNIEFVGWKTGWEKLPYLQSARCLIFSSLWYETFGLVPLEALSRGIPVLCSSVSAAQEFIEDGKNGYLYNGEWAQLAEKIVLMQDGRTVRELSQYAFAHFDGEKWGRERYLNELISLYAEMLET